MRERVTSGPRRVVASIAAGRLRTTPVGRAAGQAKEESRATEFERVKQEIAGRSITVTSWFDPAAGLWHASAPAYVGLLSRAAGGLGGAASRRAAIEAVSSRLIHHFRANPG